jgi:hypothetical protein
MKCFLTIELAQLNRSIAIAVDCRGKLIEEVQKAVRAFDPDAKEFWRVGVGVLFGVDHLIEVGSPSAQKIVDFVRAYAGLERTRNAAHLHLREPIGYRAGSARP